MTNTNELHDQAMEFVDKAYLAKRNGQVDLSVEFLQSAFELENQAAQTLQDELNIEPTRSILYRSAASLAIELGKFDDAKNLIDIALSGNPPLEISIELKNLFHQIIGNRVGKGMDVFNLRNSLVKDYADYISSFIQIRDSRIREYVEQSINDGLLWPDPPHLF